MAGCVKYLCGVTQDERYYAKSQRRQGKRGRAGTRARTRKRQEKDKGQETKTRVAFGYVLIRPRTG